MSGCSRAQIKSRSGTAEDRKNAAKVIPIIKRHHLLLVTLLLFNSLANEALPIFLDQLVPSYVAILVSVTMVLIFGEVLPAALFTGPNQLKIAAYFTNFTWFLIGLFYPISYPFSLLLDFVLGHEESTVFSREELTVLLDIQHQASRQQPHALTEGAVMCVSLSSSCSASFRGADGSLTACLCTVVDQVG